MNQKILDQVMRRMEARACCTPSKGLSPTRMQVRSGQHGLHGASASAPHSGRSVLHPLPPRRQTAHGLRVL